MTVHLLTNIFGIHTNSPVVLIAALVGATAWEGIKRLFKKKK